MLKTEISVVFGNYKKMNNMITVGENIPPFKLQNQDEVVVNSSDLKGKKLILFFYPKDDTPGCTAEACSLRDGFAELSKLGYILYGISPDMPTKHKKFKDKYGLPFDLLADFNHEMMSDFGVWGEKSMYGKKYMGVLRTTVVCNELGVVTHVISKVKTKDHSNQLLELLQ